MKEMREKRKEDGDSSTTALPDRILTSGDTSDVSCEELRKGHVKITIQTCWITSRGMYCDSFTISNNIFNDDVH